MRKAKRIKKKKKEEEKDELAYEAATETTIPQDSVCRVCQQQAAPDMEGGSFLVSADLDNAIFHESELVEHDGGGVRVTKSADCFVCSTCGESLLLHGAYVIDER